MTNETSFHGDGRLREVEMSLAVHLAECTEKSKRVGDNIETMGRDIVKMERSIEQLNITLTRVWVGIVIGLVLAALVKAFT